ncbi:MAG: hypothetical protein H6733_16070 [Alphaproteobacteria bacterium]|nr:hypothetical protein [Alphaproteobacteria bacterium]
MTSWVRSVGPMLLLGLGCRPASPDTVSFAVRLRPVTLGEEVVSFSDATFDLRVFRLRPCPVPDERLDWPGVPEDVETFPGVATPYPQSVGFTDPVDLVARARPRIPVGPWCQLDVVVDGPLTVTATLPSTGGAVTFTTTLPDVGTPFDVTFAQLESLDGSNGTATVTVTPLVVELGTALWLSSVSDRLLAGEVFTLAEDDADVGPLQAALVVGAAMYRDPDRSGTLSDTERDEDRVTGLLAL